MTLAEFRSNRRNIAAMRKLAEQPMFRLMMSILFTESPIRVPITARAGVQQTDPAYHLGTVDGALRVFDVIQSMSASPAEGTDLKTTYEPPADL